MLNTQAADYRDQFHAEHGHFVATEEGTLLFEDGAIDENSPTGLGQLLEPPIDEYELAVLKCRYRNIVAQITERNFVSYKMFLQGSGYSEFVAYTPEEQLAHLADLQRIAKQARRKYRAAKAEVEACKPEWLCVQDDSDAEDAYNRRQFLDEVDNYNL